MTSGKSGRKRTADAVKSDGARGRERAARKAAAEAKAKGAIGRGGTPQQKVLRNSAIIAAAWAGVPQKRIASDFGVTDRTVRSVVADYEAQPSGLEDRPIAIVESLCRLYRSTYRDFLMLAERYEESNAAAAIGARRQARDTLAEYVTLLASVGKLPTNLEVLRAEADLMRLGDEILQQAELAAAGEITNEQLLEHVRAFVQSHGQSVADPR